jgi:PAS domain S-box-containing protein
MSPMASDLSDPKKSQDKRDILSVLYVDDEVHLLAVCKIYLEKRGISVTTAESVRKAITLLEKSSFDVILSDYQMPETDGIEFLKMLQGMECSVPFILFTGKGREEVVIEAINNGATFYIQKGGDPKSQFAELEHKIREASRRRIAEVSLKKAELRYSTLFENSGTAIITIDDDLLITSTNSCFLFISGYERGEVEGVMHWTDCVPDEEAEMLAEQLLQIRTGHGSVPHRFAILLITREKRTRHMLATAALIPGTDMTIVSLIDQTCLNYMSGTVRRKGRGPCPSSEILRGNRDVGTGNA